MSSSRGTEIPLYSKYRIVVSIGRSVSTCSIYCNYLTFLLSLSSLHDIHIYYTVLRIRQIIYANAPIPNQGSFNISSSDCLALDQLLHDPKTLDSQLRLSQANTPSFKMSFPFRNAKTSTYQINPTKIDLIPLPHIL